MTRPEIPVCVGYLTCNLITLTCNLIYNLINETVNHDLVLEAHTKQIHSTSRSKNTA